MKKCENVTRSLRADVRAADAYFRGETAIIPRGIETCQTQMGKFTVISNPSFNMPLGVKSVGDLKTPASTE